MTKTPRTATIRESDQAYGRVEAFLHVAGYTMARAFADIEYLLDEKNRWKEFGFTEVNAFLASFNFKEIEANLETRKRLAKRIKELQPDASGRQIARTVGIDEGTLRADKSAKAQAKAKEKQRPGADASAERPALSGADAAAIVRKREENAPAKARAAAEARTQVVELDAAALGKFAVIYADPPWRYENPPMGGSNRSIENQYPTMTLEEICALPVTDIANDNCVLFLWATTPKLYECMKVLDAWGFVYRTSMVWVKDKIGMGYHVRGQHEDLLIAKRGELPPPSSENRPSSVVNAPRLEHSAKPPIFRDLIDQMYPGLRKIELFSRSDTDRTGWEWWGNEIKEAAE